MKLAVVRPGAIGDVIASFNYLNDLEKMYNVSFFCHDSIFVILEKFVKENFTKKFYPTSKLDNSLFDKTVSLIGYPLYEGYPFKKMEKHLLYYYAKELGVNFSFDNLFLDLPPLPAKIKNKNTPRYITIQTITNWSPYKNWMRFQELATKIKTNNPEIEIYQIGGINDPILKGIDGSFCGDSFCDNIAAQAWSSLHIGLDSVFTVTTNIQWRNKGRVKGVVLYGSTHPTGTGYPSNDNIVLNLPCQPCYKEDPKISSMSMGICNNPPNQTYETPIHSCMTGISTDMVYSKIISNYYKV